MMNLAERLLRELLGPTRRDLRPMACAMLAAERVLFLRGVSLDEFQISKHVYPDVCRELGRARAAVARSVERTAGDCWDALRSRDLVLDYIGRPLEVKPEPWQMLVYLTCYLHYSLPYFDVVTFLRWG